MIIIGFPCIGKTTVAKKYKDIYDLESTKFHYMVAETKESLKGKEFSFNINPQWPNNYINKIKKIKNKYKIIFVLSSEEIINLLLKENIDFTVALPSFGQKQIYINRAINRGNNKEYIKGFKERYNKWRERLLVLNKKQIILKKNEFIEDYLIKN